ncbi:MAG: lysylphosphatidylglycerol synthase transmembrane domain-containing protein [Candidatus Nanopelagicales bacterium]
MPAGDAATDGSPAPRRTGSTVASLTRPLHRLTGLRFYSSQVAAPRVRRPTDVMLVVLGLLVVGIAAFVAPGPTDLDNALVSLIKELPGFISWAWNVCYAALALWGLVLVAAALLRRGRRRLLLDYLTAGVLSFVVAVLTSIAAGTSLSATLTAFTSAEPPSVYLATRLAVVTAVITTASPHVTRPLRWVGRLLIVLGGVAAVVIGIATPLGAFAGFAVGLVGAGLTHLALGSPDGRPSPDQVHDALADLGVDVVDVSDAVVQVPGVALFDADTPDRDELLVKVYGRDAWDGQFLASIWTALWKRGERPRLGSGRLQLVEHEAVATLLAERAGVPVLPVVAVGRSVDGDAVLVNEVSGRPLTHLPEAEIDDELLRACWRSLVALHQLDIAHGRIDGERLVLRDGGGIALGDLGEAELAASQGAILTDRARMLVTTALLADRSRAVAAAVDVIGEDGLGELLPYLQPAVLGRGTRRAVSLSDWTIEDLATDAVAATGVDRPALQRIQRVTWKSFLIVVGVGVLTYAVITRLLGVDFSAIWTELSTANWAWLAAALLLAPTVQMAMAFSTMGASVAPLRYGPVLLLQYAIQFIALTLPSTAARLALEVRFFEKFGIAPGAALSMGMIDSVSGFVVQVLLLALIALTGLPGFTSKVIDPDGSSSSDTSSGPSLLAVVAVLIVVGLLVSLVVPRLRKRLFAFGPRVVASVREQLGEVKGAISVLRSPRKVSMMLGGNFVAQVIQAIILGVCLAAFDSSASLSQLILINTCVSLFAGLMPVPGGMGVAEAGYTAGLQAVGVPSTVAISTAIAFRLVTFYLPPLWGAFSMRWLHRHSYV